MKALTWATAAITDRPKRLWVAAAVAFMLGVGYIALTQRSANDLLMAYVQIAQDSGIAFAYVAVPVAIVASLMRFNVLESAVTIGASIIGATVTLFVELSLYRGWTMVYDILSGDVGNAFWQWPPIWLDILIAAVAAAAAWWVVGEARDYLCDYFRPFRFKG